MGSRVRIALCTAAVALFAAAPAHAAKRCAEPTADWQRATPAEAGMDAGKLQAAVDYGTENLAFAVRVYRHGCLVAEDRSAAFNRNNTYESYSMAKSVTSMFFGAAMTKDLISADDPVGSLVPEADKAHGALTLRHLLTQTSGLLWNGFRDYNVFTNNRDRLRDVLTLPPVKTPGTYFEYAQSPVSLVAEATGRAVGQDVMAFGQRELMDPLGIKAGDWDWTRDDQGRVLGYMGVQMRPDDYGRLGELFRRGGLWSGKRLLSKEYVRESITGTPTNGCYGWLIWTNDKAPCIGARVTARNVKDARDMDDIPADMYHFSGLFGQLVTVFPSQGIVVVRTGQDPGLVPAGGQSWEHELYSRVLAAVTDQKIDKPGPAPKSEVDRSNPDDGFQKAWQRTDEYDNGLNPDPLPLAGPARARAAIVQTTVIAATKRGVVRVRVACPLNWPAKGEKGCKGTATLAGARKATRYSISPGTTKVLRFTLGSKRMRALPRVGSLGLRIALVNADAGGGTTTEDVVVVTRPG
jgi:CubicO group peptidase (beta-lactamase class C family)